MNKEEYSLVVVLQERVALLDALVQSLAFYQD